MLLDVCAVLVERRCRGDTVGALTTALEGAPYGPGVDEAKARAATFESICASSLNSYFDHRT
jgi:hypothetical protein